MTVVTRLVWNNAIDSATLAATSASSSDTAVSNLQTAPRKQLWRSSSAALQTITGTWSTTQQINCCIAYRHNLTSAGYWRLRLFSDAAATAVVYDSGLALINPPKPLGELLFGYDALGATVFSGWAYAFGQMWFDSVGARAFELTLQDGANPAGYLQASRLFMGPAVTFSRLPAMGMALQYREASTQYRSDGGTLRTDAGESWRDIDLALPKMPASERATLVEIARVVGKRGDMFLSVFQGIGGTLERDYAMQCKFVDPPGSKADWPSRYSHDLRLTEA